MLSEILNEGCGWLNSSIMKWSDVASCWCSWKIRTGKPTVSTRGTIATGTTTSSDAVVSDYANWCWHAESSESRLLNFNPTQESNNQSHTTPEMRSSNPSSTPPPLQQRKQTLKPSYITYRQQRYLIFISAYQRWKQNQEKRLFPLQKSAPILQFCLFHRNTSWSDLQATNNRIGNLQSFNLTGALNI